MEGHLSCSKERWEGLNIAYWCEERRTFRKKTNTLAIAREKKRENTSGNGKIFVKHSTLLDKLAS